MTCYQEGREARGNGQTKADCPYGEQFALARRNWLEGWTDSDTMIRALEPYQETAT